MKPEEFAEELRQVLGERLRSVVLYGSAAAGDYLGKGSDYNLLVVVKRLGLEELKLLARLVHDWKKAGNPPPMLFTWDRLLQSCDVFPIEILDIKEAHRILAGEDIVQKLPVALENLRHQLEYETKARLIQLRQGFLESEGKKRLLLRLLVSSVSSILVLARGTLRLLGETPPAMKMPALHRLSERTGIPAEPFETVFHLKQGSLKPRSVDLEQLFGSYLAAVEHLADFVDAFVHQAETEKGPSD
ncbi:MAG TPA: nucleotidyltransferase domain-containing protein [Acidobacteriota bacterium]|nr:nucleotidyltransferase domain-containing protein [Acidobacteriota bacterium]